MIAMNLLADPTGLIPCCCLGGIWGGAGLLSIATLVMVIWMLVDCVTKEPSEGNDKVIWILIIIFTGLIGALLYYFIRRPERIRKYGK